MNAGSFLLAACYIEQHGLTDAHYRLDSFARPGWLADFAEGVEGLNENVGLAVFAILFRDAWSGCDGVGAFLNEFRHAFGRRRPAWWRDGAMEEKELTAFRRLPSKITIYRGCRAADDGGISWSLRREVAEKFPFYNRYRTDGEPVLLTATIKKSEVIALKLDRNEDEIITLARPNSITVESLRKPLKVATHST